MRPRDARAARTTPRARMLAISTRRSLAVMLSVLRVVSTAGSGARPAACEPLLRVPYAAGYGGAHMPGTDTMHWQEKSAASTPSARAALKSRGCSL